MLNLSIINKKMTTVVDDENYIKLGHLYNLCKHRHEILFEDKYETILSNHFDQSVLNYELPAHSLICQRKPENTGNTIINLMVKHSLEYHTCSYTPYVEILIKLGADFTIKSSNGYTPLLYAFNSNQIIDSLLKAHIQKNNATNIRCKNGISHFHVACSSDQVEVVDFFLKSGVDINERVNCDSPKFPGYTPIHFASEYRQFKTIELLLKKGANWNTEDANGVTALHLVIKELFARKMCAEIQMMLQQEIQSGILKLPDRIGLTRLHLDGVLNNSIYVQTELHENTIDSAIRFDSPLWPGRTPLHFAAAQSYSSLEAVFSLTDYGADLLAKDANGTTPLDVIFKNFDADAIIRILSRDKRYGISDLKLTNDLNLLNVLKAIRKIRSPLDLTTITEEFEYVNVYIPLESPLWPGYNLLHLAVMFGTHRYKIIEKLLSQNVDFITLTRGGMSPLHLAFRLEKMDIVKSILSYHKKIPADCVDQANLSHLHIACAAENNQVAELLLKNGADPNLHTLQDFEWTFDESKCLIRKGSTALHVAFMNLNLDLIKMLLSFKANTKATDADGITPFQDFFNKLKSFPRFTGRKLQIIDLVLQSYPDQITNVLALKVFNITTIRYHPDFCKSMVLVLDRERRSKDWGLTRLQIACALGNLSMTKEELKSGAEVNHRINNNSPLWPGDTAMHILFRINETKSRYEIANLLLDYGADPNLKNADNQTVIHLYYSQCKYSCLEDIPILLRDKHRKINPVNNEGLSHLHICCQTNHVFIIEELLKSGASVNAQVDHFADDFAGYTPLHFAVEYNKKTTVELLINYGADPNIKTVGGCCTALHLAVTSYSEVDDELVEILLRCPTIDVQAKDVLGLTVLEHIDLEPTNYRILNILLEKSLEISTNSKVFLEATFMLKTEIYKKLINNLPELTATDLKGQNVIHHIASHGPKYFWKSRDYYHRNIENLIANGCEINHKDHQGKTPLHIAISKMDCNEKIIKSLLDLGADVNIKDDCGQTPCVNILNKSASRSLVKHICKLELAEIFVDNSNKKYLENFYLNKFSAAITDEKKKLDVKLKEIHSSCSVKYFFSERFVVDYRRLAAFQRQAICNFCNLSDLHLKFPKLYHLIMRQFRKARSRTRLLEPAGDALQMLANIFLPHLCSDLILSFLSNDDIMNLIRAKNERLTFAPLPEKC